MILNDTEIIEAVVDNRDDYWMRKRCEVDRLDPNTFLAPNIVIEPFKEANISPASYDVSLGTSYYTPNPEFSGTYYIDMLEDIENYWSGPYMVEGKYMLVPAGETILSHTEEFVHLSPYIAAQMQARSSIVRSGLSIVKDGGWVDPGYSGCITIEISNLTRTNIAIPIGSRIAQLVFHRVQRSVKPYNGKYGHARNRADWDVTDILPKLHLDR